MNPAAEILYISVNSLSTCSRSSRVSLWYGQLLCKLLQEETCRASGDDAVGRNKDTQFTPKPRSALLR